MSVIDNGNNIVERHFTAKLERCHRNTPCYCLVPEEIVRAYKAAASFVVGARLNDTVDLGRRTIKPWGDGRWFLELTKAHCQKAGVQENDTVNIRTSTVPSVPPGLVETIKSRGLISRWNQLSEAQRRSFCETVFQAKGDETRERRVARVISALECRE